MRVGHQADGGEEWGAGDERAPLLGAGEQDTPQHSAPHYRETVNAGAEHNRAAPAPPPPPLLLDRGAAVTVPVHTKETTVLRLEGRSDWVKCLLQRRADGGAAEEQLPPARL